MSTLAADRQRHEERAAWCEKQLTVEEALLASRRLDALEAAGNDATKLCLEGYQDFGMWAAEVEKAWSYKPESYDEPTHAGIKVLRKLWFSLFSRLVGFLDADPCRSLGIKREADARRCYSIMLSIESMDQAEEMPDGMRELAENALADYRAGRGEERPR